MDRNEFLKLVGLTGIALAAFPQWAFRNNEGNITHDELIGKGSPKLFGEGFKLRQEAYDSYNRMKIEAKKSAIILKPVSSYRDFKHQNSIWERKFKSYVSQGFTEEASISKIIEYSTIPGTSRHHWGTDIDIVDANVKQPSNLLRPSNFETDHCFGKFKRWMDTNANDFGFYLVYTNDAHRTGFKYEPWHYSYRPLSCQYLSAYRHLNLYEILQKENLMGHEHLSESFISNYFKQHILDINPALF